MTKKRDRVPNAIEAVAREPKRILFWSACEASTYGDTPLSKLTGLPVLRPPIRSSGIVDADHCLRYYVLKDRMGLRGRRYDSALTIGRVYHSMRRLLSEGRDESIALHKAASMLAAWQQAIADDTDARGLHYGTDATNIIEKSNKDWGIARAMAVWAHRQSHSAGLDPTSAQRYEVIACEQNIEIFYASLKTPIRVRLDALLLDTRTGSLYIGDHKTTSDDPSLVMQAVRFAVQPKLYRLAVECWKQNDPDAPQQPLTGFIHDVIKKLGIRTKIGESMEVFIGRVSTEYAANTKAALAGTEEPKFLRSKVNFDDKPLMDEEFLLHLRQADRQAYVTPTLARFPRTPNPLHTCFTYGKPCEFHTLCSANPARWCAEIIPNHYTQEVREDAEERDDLAWNSA